MNQASTQEKIRTPDQRRAKAALDALKDNKIGDFEEFAKTCKKTSSRILTSGLLPALAFLEAKPDGQNKPLHNALTDYLVNHGFAPKGRGSLVENFCEQASPLQLRRTQAETLAYLDWLTRFAEARKAKAGKREDN